MSEERPTEAGHQEQAHRPTEHPIPVLRRQSVLWRHLDAPGYQLARFSDIPDGYIVDGRVLTVFDDRPAEVHFAIMCRPDWTTRRAFAAIVQGTSSIALKIRRDDEGQWWIARGANVRADPSNETRLHEVDGVFDIDLGISPATNTLPIRRLDLAVGESHACDALWVGFPELAVERLPQRYTREAENVYRYESSGGAFTARLEVDENGVMVRYGELWERIAASTSGG